MTKEAAARELRESLKRVGLPQSRAAKRLDVSTPYLNRVLKGAKEPSDELHQRMIELLKALKRSGLMEAG